MDIIEPLKNRPFRICPMNRGRFASLDFLHEKAHKTMNDDDDDKGRQHIGHFQIFDF